MSVLKKYYYRALSPFRKAYWFLFRPETVGVKVVISCDGKFLCIRNSYGTGVWTFPGGGVRQSETPEQAAHREVLEEVGIKLASVKQIGTYTSNREYKKDIVHCFYSEVDSCFFQIGPSEVLEADWFTLDAIPEPRSSAVAKISAML